MRARQMYSRVGIEAGLDTLEESRRATTAVLHALRDRLTREEASHAAAQLPRELKAPWGSGHPALDRPLRLPRPEFLERVRLGPAPSQHSGARSAERRGRSEAAPRAARAARA